ncbi:hypothetical protein Tco_1008945 [Tanacetum coccineum]
MLESEAYKTYLAYATGEKIPKPKYVKNKANSKSSPKKKTATTAKGKRLKTSAKAAKPAKKKQPVKTSKAKGLTMLSEVAITEAEQMKLATNRSLIETHSSYTSGSGADEGTGSKPGVLNVPTYGSDDEQISWKSSDKEDDDEVGLNDDDDDDDNDDDEDNDDDDDDDADNQDNDDQEDDGQDDEDQDDVGHTEAYKTYLAYATGEKIPKPKYVKNKANSKSSPKKKTATTAKGKRLKTLAKAAKPAKKKQPVKTSKAKGLTMLSEVAITEAEQTKLAINRSLIETHSSYTSGSGADEGTGSKPGVLNVLTYGSDDEQISWKSSDKEDDDEVGLNDDDDDDDDNDDDEDNDDDDDDADNQDNDDQEDEDQDDVNEQTDLENDDDDFVHPKLSTQDKVRHNKEVSDEESDEEIQGANVEEEELDEEETNDEDEANELYRDVNNIVLLCHLASFDHRLKTLENDFSEFKQTNQFAAVVSSIPGIVDTYLANKMNEAVKTIVQLQSDRLRDEARAENEDFLNKLDDNIKKMQTSSINLMITLRKIFKIKRRDEEDKDEEPSTGSNRGSKRRRAGKEPESTSTPKEKTSKDNRQTAGLTLFVEMYDMLYTFKDCDFKRFSNQDIEDMLFLLVQGKLTNLTIEEHLAFNVSLRMFTRSVVIQRRVEDLQLGVESYQKKLNLIKLDMYRSDLKRKEAYSAYSNPRSFIYQNKDKKNRLMRIDELHKFNDGTFNDVRTALDDRLKGI